MLQLLLVILLLIATPAQAFIGEIREEDGSPSSYPYALKVTNGSLTDNGDGTVSITTGGGGGGSMAIGSTVTSGTTGSALFVGSGPVLAQDNANFFWDDTNNRLGIGTITPTSQLTLHDGTYKAGLIAFLSGGADAIIVRNAAGNGNGNFEAAATLVSSLRVTGLAGFGTTATAGQQITVVNAASTNKGIVVRGAASQSANLTEWQNSSGTVLTSINSVGDLTGVRGRFTVDSGTAFVVETAAGVDALNIATTTMLATFGGNIHFPGGAGNYVGSDSQNGFTIDASYNLVFNAITGMYFNVDSNATGGVGDIVFGKDRSTVTGGTEFLRILESNGNVGIGNVSPSEKLNVTGNILASGTVLGSNLSGTNTGDQTTISGNAGTATALAANGANCSAGSAPLGVDASGAAETCTDYEEDLSNEAGLYAALSDVTQFYEVGDDVTADVSAASSSASGIAELAIASEVDTGTDTARAITPDALAGSNLGEKAVSVYVVSAGTATAVGDGTAYFNIPSSVAGMDLVEVHAHVITAGTTGTTDIQIHNLTSAVDMLSTKLTIDSAETSSSTAATAAVINGSNDDVVANELIRIDVDAVSTTPAQGLVVTLIFRLP